MSEYETITLDATRAGIAILTLNRPERHNAFNSQVIEELTDALETLEEQDTLRMVILRGAGKSFSAGADLVCGFLDGSAVSLVGGGTITPEEINCNFTVAQGALNFFGFVDGDLTVDDFQAWTGLPKRVARSAAEGCSRRARHHWMPAASPRRCRLR